MLNKRSDNHKITRTRKRDFWEPVAGRQLTVSDKNRERTLAIAFEDSCLGSGKAKTMPSSRSGRWKLFMLDMIGNRVTKPRGKQATRRQPAVHATPSTHRAAVGRTPWIRQTAGFRFGGTITYHRNALSEADQDRINRLFVGLRELIK